MNRLFFFRRFIYSISILLFHLNLNAQTTIEDPQYFYGCEGDTVILIPEVDPDFIFPNATFDWTDPNGFTTMQTEIPYIIPMAGSSDEGQYSFTIKDGNTPTTIYSNLQFQLLETDTAGGKIFPDQIIVQYVDDVTQAFKDSLRMEFEGNLIDMCVCGTLELWQLIPEDPIIVNGMALIDINSKIESLRMNVKTKEVERNRPVEANDAKRNNFALMNNNITWEDTQPPVLINDCDTVVVAVIDNGVAYNHIGFDQETAIWNDESEALNPGIDANDNCLIDDVLGWDFSDDDADPEPLTDSHGTHVTGIIDTTFHNYNNTSTILEIMPIRTLDENGDGDLFDLICGVLYAKNQNANIINLSLGWQGAPSLILEKAIENDNECGYLFIASAGNESTDNDVSKHYPGGYDLDNIIEVASIDSVMNNEVVFFNNTPDPHYSNFGQSVDLAAQGHWISTFIGDAHGVKEGTSMSSGYVAGIAAAMKAAAPHVTPTTLRNVLLNNATQSLSDFTFLVNNGRIVFPNQIPNAISIIQNFPETPCDCLPEPVGIEEAFTNPKSTWLKAYPNPSNGEVYLNFSLAQRGETILTVHNSQGQLIDNQIFNLTNGEQQIIWNKATDLPKGVYFFQIKTARELFVGKVFMF